MSQFLSDTVSYIVFTNPLSTALVDVARKTGYVKSKAATKTLQPMAIPLWRYIGSSHTIIRVAGLCGASAVVLGAYGSHKSYPDIEDNAKKDLRKIFETANRFHFMHTLALLGTPFCRYPKVSASFMSLGMLFFCGSCYYHAFTGDHKFGRMAPVGGLCLILGWLTMIV